MSERTLYNRLEEFNLKRRGNGNNIANVQRMEHAIMKELDGPNSLFGYRLMWDRLKTFHGLYVPRSLVMQCIRNMDPEGVEMRRSHRLKRRVYLSLGPNFCWHMDGYDKLKPYGFPIHGCIDGYSRKILWLKFVSSNNNPFIVAQCSYLFLKEILEMFQD